MQASFVGSKFRRSNFGAKFYFFREISCEFWAPSTCLYSNTSKEAGYLLVSGGGELHRASSNPHPSDKFEYSKKSKFERVRTCSVCRSQRLVRRWKTDKGARGGAGTATRNGCPHWRKPNLSSNRLQFGLLRIIGSKSKFRFEINACQFTDNIAAIYSAWRGINNNGLNLIHN